MITTTEVSTVRGEPRRINGRSMVIGAGKMGYVYAMNAYTGQLIWKSPVGQHNGHDDDSLQALEHHSTLKAPYTILPGSIGGVLFNPAVAGHSVYVATNDLQYTATSLNQAVGTASGKATGEVEALNLATRKVEWDTKVPTLPLGAATVSNDLVFTTLISGALIALDRTTGEIVYSNPLPATTKAPIAIAGNTVLVAVGTAGGQQQLRPGRRRIADLVGVDDRLGGARVGEHALVAVAVTVPVEDAQALVVR
jgi:alcohol dehydrogenase (cytochrome c)